MKRAYHHGDLRDALVAAAEAELAEVGPEALSLRAVARRAGVSHTAAYHHFADKIDLLRAVAAVAFQKLDRSVARAVTAENGDAIDRLTGAGRGYLRFARTHPALLALLFESRLGPFDADPALHAAATQAFARLADCVREARAASGHRDDPMPDALLCWGLLHGLAALSQGGGLAWTGLDDDALMELVRGAVTRWVRPVG